MTIRSHRRGERPLDKLLALSAVEGPIDELSKLLVAVEREYASPQDIEWCYDGTQFWIVQSRPITTDSPRRNIEWTRANLVEVLPEITSPQALQVFERMLNAAERRHLGRLLAPYDVLGPMAKPFYGRLYFNLSQFRHVCLVSGTPPALMLRSVGHAGDISPEDERAPRPPIGRFLVALPNLARLLWRHARAGRIVRASGARLRAFHAALSARNPEALPDREIWATLTEWASRGSDWLDVVLLLSGVLLFETPLRKICSQVGFPFERLLYSYLAAGERSVSAQQAFDLVALADVARKDPLGLNGPRFAAALAQFLEQYGHRGRYESDWSLPRYSEDPTPILEAVRLHLRDGNRSASQQAPERLEAEGAAALADFERTITGLRRWTLLPRARWLLKRIKEYYVWREQCRSDLIRVLAVVRRWHLTLARRFVERGWIDRVEDYFLILYDEIAAVIEHPSLGDALRTKAVGRAAAIEQYQRLEMPLLMRESELPRLVRAAPAMPSVSDGHELRGVPVSRGSAEGEVVVIHDPGDFAHMKRGAILVTVATDPSWTPLFTLAAGVVVEVGGILSHASTVAREYGIPALANVRHATRRLRTGDRVLLNADAGVLTVLSPAPSRSS